MYFFDGWIMFGYIVDVLNCDIGLLFYGGNN